MYRPSKATDTNTCPVCSEKTDWVSDDCIWMCRRKNKQLYRLYYHVKCFESIAGEEASSLIFERGVRAKKRR